MADELTWEDLIERDIAAEHDRKIKGNSGGLIRQSVNEKNWFRPFQFPEETWDPAEQGLTREQWSAREYERIQAEGTGLDFDRYWNEKMTIARRPKPALIQV